MPRRPSLPRRLDTATRWRVGVALTSWNYMWRTTPRHRSEEIGGAAPGPPPLPAGLDRAELQTPLDGAGPYFPRVFRTRMRDTDLTPEALVERLAPDLNQVAPNEFAHFQKVHGEEGDMRMGD